MDPDRNPETPAGRRRLFLIAVRDYPDEGDDFRAGIDAQITAASTWWADKDALGDRAFSIDAAAKIHSREDLDDFIRDTGLRRAGAGDVLVVHLTGHGERGQSGTHRLIMPGGDPRRPDRDAYPTGDLISAALSSDAGQVLIIVNACYAKAVQADVLRVAQDLPRHRREHATLAVIATVDADDRPRDREFATLLDRVHAQLCTTAGIAAEHLTLEEFLTELTRAALQDPGQPLAVPHRVWETWRTRYPMRSLPNPGYRPPADLAGPQRRQVAADATELDYWLDRASGRPDHDPGWYFTGRADLNRATARFLTGDGGVLIVTGSAGSGKSAVIARAVTLSDPDVLARPRYARAAQAAPPGTLPPPGAVDVALLARNTDSVDLLTRLVTALGEQPRPAPDHGDPGQHLREQITEIISARFAGTGRPVTVVVDGLDEATRPTRLVADLLGPLARLATPAGVHLVRLLVGVRSSTPHHALPAAEFDTLLDLLQRATAAPPGNVLRTDTDGVYDDLATYAETLLAAGDGPYAGDDEAVRAARTETAAVIAARVQPSFLDTRLAAGHLRGRLTRQPLDDPAWLASLTDATIGQLRLDLRDNATDDYPVAHLTGVLRAAAFALGAGIPWADIWPAMTEAVLDTTLPDADGLIGHVLSGRLGGYLVSDVEDGRTVYRLVHERLAEVLRQDLLPHRQVEGA